MPVLTYCNLEGKISTKYLAPILTNILSLPSLGMGISTLLGARGGQFGRSREKYMDCRNCIAARVQGAKISFYASHHSSFNKLPPPPKKKKTWLRIYKHFLRLRKAAKSENIFHFFRLLPN